MAHRPVHARTAAAEALYDRCIGGSALKDQMSTLGMGSRARAGAIVLVHPSSMEPRCASTPSGFSRMTAGENAVGNETAGVHVALRREANPGTVAHRLVEDVASAHMRTPQASTSLLAMVLRPTPGTPSGAVFLWDRRNCRRGPGPPERSERCLLRQPRQAHAIEATALMACSGRAPFALPVQFFRSPLRGPGFPAGPLTCRSLPRHWCAQRMSR